MAIDYLVAVIAPPSKSTEAPMVNEWAMVESRLGVSLPDDYKEFIETYGSGQIDKFIWVFNPFSTNEHMNLERQADTQAKVLAELQLYGETVPYKSFPERDGVLPFGITDNGDVLFWRTIGSPNDWTVVVNESRSPEWESFGLSMSRFLASILQRQLVCNVFPKSFPGQQPLFEPCP